MTQRLISSDVTWCSCSCRLFSFIEISVVNGILIVPILIAGYVGSRCLSTAVFVKEIDSFNGVACNPHHCKVLHCQLSRMSKHFEHQQSAVNKIKRSVQTHSSVHTLHMYISSCNENTEIMWAVWVLMDGILVTMNQVDLARPNCIYLINATSEVYPFAMSVLLTPKGLWYKYLQSLILCTLVSEYSLSNQRHRYIPSSWPLGISCSSTDSFTKSTPQSNMCTT